MMNRDEVLRIVRAEIENCMLDPSHKPNGVIGIMGAVDAYAEIIIARATETVSNMVKAMLK